MDITIVKAVFGGLRKTRTAPVYRDDHDLILQLVGVKGLPVHFQAHFANTEYGTAVVMMGSDGEVTIPNSLLATGLPIYCWVIVESGISGRVTYSVQIPVRQKARPDGSITPEQADIISQAISALNDAGAAAQEAADSAAQSAADANADAQTASDAKTYVTEQAGIIAETRAYVEENVAGFEDKVSAAISDVEEVGAVQKNLATAQAENSEAWAVGNRNGSAVPSTDPSYQNNAKYYAEQASESARTLTIDNTLTKPGQAADAKVVGDKVEYVESDTLFITENDFDGWRVGKVNGSTGGGINTGVTKFIRVDNVTYRKEIKIINGYVGIYIWDSADTYKGFWDGTDYIKENNDSRAIKFTGIIDLSAIVPENGKSKIVFKRSDGEDINITDSGNVQVIKHIKPILTEQIEELARTSAIADEAEWRLNYTPNGLKWRTGRIDPNNGSTKTTTAAAICTYINNVPMVVKCKSGYFRIFVYDSTQTYVGWWTGDNISTETSNVKKWYSSEAVDLSDIVNIGDYYRIDFYPTGSSEYIASLNDATYLCAVTDRFLHDENRISEAEKNIVNLSVINDFTNASHCNAAFGRPQVIRINNLRDQIYVGYLDNNGNQGVMSYNMNTGAICRINLRKSVEDDHNQMMLCELDDHKILAICADHASNIYHYCYQSLKAEDISKFEQVGTISLPTGYTKTTYTQIIKTNNAIYVFLRAYIPNDLTTECWGYSYSTDGGSTWSEPKMFVKATGKKYYACAYKYNDSKIKVYLFSNYSTGETDIRFCYIDIINDAILDTDGITELATLSTLSEPLEYTLYTIIQNKGDYRLQLIEGYEGTDNSYIVAQYTQTNTSMKCNAIYCEYDSANNTWELHSFPYSLGDNISSGVPNELIRISNNKFIASRHLSGYWVLEEYLFNNGVFTFVKEIARTKSDAIGLIRPIYADGVVVYLRGNYTNYMEYEVDSCIYRIETGA